MNFEISAGKRAQAFQGQVGMEDIYRWTQDRVRLWKQLSCALLYKKHGLLPVTTSPAAGDTLVHCGSLLPMGNSGPVRMIQPGHTCGHGLGERMASMLASL